MDVNTIYCFLFGLLLGILHACVAFYFYLRQLHRHLSEHLEELRDVAGELVRSVEELAGGNRGNCGGVREKEVSKNV